MIEEKSCSEEILTHHQLYRTQYCRIRRRAFHSQGCSCTSLEKGNRTEDIFMCVYLAITLASNLLDATRKFF